jgi:putative ABC transport system permease protein
MALHDRMKLAGALLGVVFATFLGAQQLGIFMGLVKKNTLLTDGIVTDVWIAPHGTRQASATVTIPERALYVARTTPGVAWADPLLLAQARVVTEGGTSRPVQLVGFEPEGGHGGPWNVTAGDVADLRVPGKVFVDTIDRTKNGGVNLGSVREINGRQVQVVGFTSGLQPFGPTYAFADYDTALRLLGRVDRDPNYVLVGVADGEDADAVVERLQAQLPDLDVMTRRDLPRPHRPVRPVRDPDRGVVRHEHRVRPDRRVRDRRAHDVLGRGRQPPRVRHAQGDRRHQR